MKQVIRKGLRDIIVEEVPDPVASPHHVLVRPVYSLISSGTETASIHQEALIKEVAERPSHLKKVWEVMKSAGPVPTMREVLAKFSEFANLGYSGAGVLVDKHPTVTNLEIGDRVVYGGQGTGHGETILAGRNLVARIPDNVSFEHACFTTLGAIALNAVRTARISLGDAVAVIGLGLVGQLVCQLARLQGGIILALDLKEDRVRMAKELGAHHGILAGASALEAVKTVTNGRGADWVILAAASKSPAASLQALEICRDRGAIVVVGAVPLEFPWEQMYLKEIQLLMSRAYGPGSYDSDYEKHGRDYPLPYVRWTENRNMEEFLRLLGAGEVRLQPLITHTFDLQDAPKAYQTILDPVSGSLAVLLRYPEAASPQPGARFAPCRKAKLDARPAAKSDLRVALVGAGNLARWVHLPNLKKLPHVRLQAIYSANPVRGKSYAARFGAAYSCTDYREILQDPEVDVVLISSRNQDHAPQALQALRAGKHVFVEKPMALTEQECRDLEAAVRETGKLLTVGFNRRFAPLYREQKRALKRRAGPAVLHCRVNSPGISGDYWMADPAIGGAILGEACHFVDLMYWLLESEPIAVSAFCLPSDKKDPIGTNNMVASFRFADGSVGSLTYCTVGSKTSGGERIEAFAPGLGVTCERFKKLAVQMGMEHVRRKWWPDKGYDVQLSCFFEAVRQGKTPEVTVLDGVRATVGCLQMLASARQLAPCAIDLEAVLGPRRLLK